MSTNNKSIVSEKELDNLLGQAFLNLDFNNPKNQELMETISTQVLSSQPVSTIVLNKALFIKITSTIILIALSSFIYYSFFKTKHQNKIQNITSKVNTASQPNLSSKQPIANQITEQINLTSHPKLPTKQAILPVFDSVVVNQQPFNQTNNHSLFVDNKKTPLEDTGYVFPKLTEKEIKATLKQKEKMTNWLSKKSKDKYALIIPNGGDSLFTNNNTTSMFYIQNSEVSNLEYRTFLFDLLIQSKKAEFLIAKPNQSLWLNTLNTSAYNSYKDVYFSDKKFDDYPVVNISKEGAELYCEWLSELSKKGYPKIKARLPFENEWLLAAKTNISSSYPWGSELIQNQKGCYLANFNIKKLADKLQPSTYCTSKTNTDAITAVGCVTGEADLFAPIYSYNPNKNGLYCMAGNVAEMVYDNKTKDIITKGGSWNSDFEHCKIMSDDEFEGKFKPNTMTGFRPVFRPVNNPSFGTIDRDDKQTGISTLTPEEENTAIKQKKKMMDALISKSKDKYALIPTGSCEYKKETISVQAFYMQTTEVTNLEYRTFLADLLMQHRLDDYKLAKPIQEMWTNKFPWSFNEPMTNMYFWHPAYDDYPVVNISRKAAIMYCKWLTIETNKTLSETNKPLINDVRLPDEYEWTYAASNGKNYVKNANGNTYLRDSKGKYEMNYMCVAKEDCKFDTILKLFIPKSKNASFVDDGAFHTSYTKAYSANSYGLYCMSGNVSEMIINHKTKQPETKGGSWFSCDYFLQIDAEDEFKNEVNASPLIGFRPVMSYTK